MRRFFCSLAVGVLLLAASQAWGQATQPGLANLKPNDAVMVREGDTWSKATLVAREGRRYQIKYDDGTLEWVTAERLQLPGAPGAATPPTTRPGAAPASQPAAAPKPPLPTFVIGQKVELKYHGRWEPVKVTGKRGDWYLVEYEKWRNWKEWAEPWRLRKVGSTYDIDIGFVSNPRVNGNEGPPRPTPGDPPVKDQPGGRDPFAGDDNKPARDDPFAPPPTGFPVTEVKTPPTKRAAVAPAGGWRLTPPALTADAKLPAPKAGLLPPLEFGIQWQQPRYANQRVLLPVFTATGFKRQSGFVRVNVLTGEAARFEINTGSAALALSPSGNLVLCRSNGFHSGTKSRLDLYRIGATIEHVISYFPEGKDADVEDAFFTDETTAVVVTSKSVSAWDVAAATGKWAVETSRGSNARSADGKLLAVQTPLGLTLLSVADGSVQAVFPGESGYGEIAFSGDGLRLVNYSRPMLRTWDLQTGQLDEVVGLSDNAPFGKIVVPNKDFVLIGRGLFSMRKKDFVWQYAGVGDLSLGADRIWSIGDDGSKKFLTSAQLPHPKAVQAAQQAPVAVALVRPGMGVTLDIAVEADEAKQAAIRDALTRQLTQAGFKIADDQPLRLTARTEDGPSQTREYRTRQFGQPGGGNIESVTITPKITRLSLERDGAVLWKTQQTTSGDPGMIVMLKEGESIQDKANQRTPAVDWLLTTKVPSLIVQTTDLKTVPASNFAIGGVVDR